MKQRNRVKMMALVLMLALSVLMSATVTAYAVNDTAIPASFQVIEDPVLKFKSDVIRLINEERAKAGVAGLAIMDTLTAAADTRAKESAELFDHTRPNNTKWFTIFGEKALQYKAAGENLAYGFTTAESVVDAWMDSASHKTNILAPDFTYVGIGYFVNAGGKVYVSQLFYTPQQ